MEQRVLSDARLAVLSCEPLNAETRLEYQHGRITPRQAFYKRNHFAIPALDAAKWRLRIGGRVARPRELTYDEILSLPSRTVLATLECAGNGRGSLQPAVHGETWGLGAVGTAEWTGARLAEVLKAAEIGTETCEIVITGADKGAEPECGKTIHYVRSLPRAVVLDPGALLVYAMNGEPLAPEHGYPVRLIVPGWYGMAAVKWVTDIEAVEEPFRGFFQTDRYVILSGEGDAEAATPLTQMAVRSVIARPQARARLKVGRHVVRGYAWSGYAPIARVEVSVDDGRSWHSAELDDEAGPFAWRRWEYEWEAIAAGPATLRSRATDGAGNTQPEEPCWNRLGYANNAIQAVGVRVIDS
jgi:DMSO/TMAO reductase YedYZ molybdopterin-dependent catalytic subunit